MKYGKYFQGVIAGLIILCLTYVGVVYAQVGAPTKSSEIRHKTLLVKHELYQKMPKDQNKLVFISGSNSLQGLSCQQIEEEIEINCFNGGIAFALGIDYIFYNAKKWVKPGDVVLLPLEYESYLYNGEPNNTAIDYIFARDYPYFKQSGWDTQMKFMGGVSFLRLVEGIESRDKNEDIDLEEQFSRMNEYGDATIMFEETMTAEQIEKRDKLPPWQSLIKSHYVSESKGLSSIEKFIKYCRDNDIEVLATWPNTIRFEIYQQPNTQSLFKSIADFYAHLEVPIIGTPEQAMYDISLFYDSQYHLHNRGVKIRTADLIEQLKPHLTDKTHIRIRNTEIS